jgi:hypothetical protein
MPKKSFIKKDSWEGRHKSYEQKIDGYYNFDSYKSGQGLDAYRKVSKEFQDIIAKAVKKQWTLRAMGSSWSLSKCGVTKNRLISSKNLRRFFSVGGSFVDPTYNKDSTKLRFFECGYTLKQINIELMKKGLSLTASGSNNGQTLPGVVSTNTHGSAYKFGSTPEMVVGIHLITGPLSQVYLERESYPVVTKKFTDELGSKLVRDDALFNAALVSFGSFGIIRGMMIETRELFLLHLSRKFRPFNKALENAILSLDFSGFKKYFKELETRATDRNNFPVTFNEKSLYHFQVTFSPNQAEKGKRPKEAALFFGFAGEYRDDYTRPPQEKGSIGPGASGIELLGHLMELTPGPLKKFVKKQLNTQVQKLFQYEFTGTFQELFRDEKTRGKVFASGIGVSLSRALDVIDIALRTYEDFDTVMPVLITMRFVKGTKATLGFTKFKPTCVIELDGLNTQNMQEYVNLVWELTEQAGIPFTMHWGKFNEHLNAKRIKAMYGSKRNQWIESREKLLSADTRRVFTNDFLKRVGLST